MQFKYAIIVPIEVFICEIGTLSAKDNKNENHMLTKKQFDILEAMVGLSGVTQRKVQSITGMSLGTVNRTVKCLLDMGYVENGTITEKGLCALEPYKVKRAIILAAGFGSRLVPVTLNTPKPLVRVHGVRIIDTLLDALMAAGISEIYIVRGYLAEQFDQLLYKYPTIKFLENVSYNESNNISSAMCARFLFSNAYVCEADLLLNNQSIIKPYQYASNYLGFKVDRTDDWCFEVKDGVINELKVGGLDCYQEIGISYWDEEDGRKLSDHVAKVYEMPGGKERYWDCVPLQAFKDEYRVKLRECRREDVIEIDTFRELKELDSLYNV